MLHFRPDARLVWENEEVRRRLSWYRSVMLNEKPAKFLICAHIAAPENPAYLADDELWNLHSKMAEEFSRVFEAIKSGSSELDNFPVPETSFLDVKVELVKRILKKCIFCERRCEVDRTAGEKGFCRLDKVARVSSWFHHWGEEAPLIGRGGSGTIFFSSCNFRCVFCQNWDISTNPNSGIEIDPMTLSKMAEVLRREGAANINYVGGEPTPNLHVIVESIKHLRVNVPLLWNSNMYCSIETMRILAELIDIWLPDFKYGNDECAQRLSAVSNYFEIVSRNHKLAYESSSGNMIIRHLVLPGHVDCCTKPILDWIAKNTPLALVNIMEQYRPEHLVLRFPERYPDIARRPSRAEMREAYEYARELGILFEPVS